MSEVRASVLIPTHDHATTLPLTVATVLAQSVREIEAIIVGDGVTEELRRVAEELAARDGRVRFLDLPKGPHHGEVHRHEAIMLARSDAICYLCDDDLLLPDHVADLLDLLGSARFVQSRNGYVDDTGQIELYPTDLADPACVAWHLREPRRNMTSLTGTAHSRAFYLEVGDHWETTPAEQWPDHYQWKKLMRHPSFTGATSRRMTALQFPTSMNGRDGWSPRERYEELVSWSELVARPGAQERIDELVDLAARRRLAYDQHRYDDVAEDRLRAYAELGRARQESLALHAHLAESRERLGRARRRLRRRRAANDRLRAANDRLRVSDARLRRQLAALRASRSWRLTAPLRRLGGLLRRAR